MNVHFGNTLNIPAHVSTFYKNIMKLCYNIITTHITTLLQPKLVIPALQLISFHVPSIITNYY